MEKLIHSFTGYIAVNFNCTTNTATVYFNNGVNHKVFFTHERQIPLKAALELEARLKLNKQSRTVYHEELNERITGLAVIVEEWA